MVKNAKVSQVKFVGGDPYQGMWELLCWINLATHKFVSIQKFMS